MCYMIQAFMQLFMHPQFHSTLLLLDEKPPPPSSFKQTKDGEKDGELPSSSSHDDPLSQLLSLP